MKNTDFEYGTFVSASHAKEKKEKEFEVFDWEVPWLDESNFGNKSAKKKTIKVRRKKTESARHTQAGKSKPGAKTHTRPASKKTDSRLMEPKYSIGLKLIAIISAIVVISLGLITSLVSYYVSADTRVNAEDNNFTINSRTASDVENRINSIISSVGMFYDLLDSAANDENEIQKNSSVFFERNKDIAGVYFASSDKTFTNRQFLISHDIDSELIESYVEQESEEIEAAQNGESRLKNATPFFATPVIALIYPLYSGTHGDVSAVLFSSEALSDSFSTGTINSSFLVNQSGEVVLHPDYELILNGSDFSDHVLVAEMLTSTTVHQQNNFKDSEGNLFIGAYNKISYGNCGVITQVGMEDVLAGINRTTKRNVYLTIAILAFAVLIIWIFARSMSQPLKMLTEVANEINSGNFETELLSQLETKRRDEIGVLTQSTKAEQDILNTFTRLTNKGVTRAIVRKEIDFEPHLKDITIFFSDIRGFTAISDGFNNRFGEKSAGEIISFLNDYMGRMVNCITISGGNVDKFEGDAIMACWGVLRDDNLDFEKWPDTHPLKAKKAAEHRRHVRTDVLNAVRASLAMRYSLMEYNKAAEAFTKAHSNDPKAKYKPHIRIGSGLNSGRATVGFMGSYDKMEFTSIGDAVNLASRTESSNKPCGTDLLITQDTYNLLKDFIRCKENNFKLKPENEKYEIIVEMIPVTFEVKGKGKQHFYGVVNMPNFDIAGFFRKGDPNFKVDPDCEKAIGPKGPKTLNEVRELLGIPIPDFSGVNLDAEESKVTAS